jgi:hypothetical protein
MQDNLRHQLAIIILWWQQQFRNCLGAKLRQILTWKIWLRSIQRIFLMEKNGLNSSNFEKKKKSKFRRIFMMTGVACSSNGPLFQWRLVTSGFTLHIISIPFICVKIPVVVILFVKLSNSWQSFKESIFQPTMNFFIKKNMFCHHFSHNAKHLRASPMVVLKNISHVQVIVIYTLCNPTHKTRTWIANRWDSGDYW